MSTDYDGLFENKDEFLKIRPFNWQKTFADIFKQGGFDAVIGNPPYIKEYTSRTAFEAVKRSHLKKYYQGKMDLWYFFACYGLDILKEDGLLGFIAPSNWRTNAGASIMRNKILNEARITEYVDFGEFKVFNNASIQTMIFILKKSKIIKPYVLELSHIENKSVTNIDVKQYLSFKKDHVHIKRIKVTLDRDKLLDKTISFAEDLLNNLLDKLASNKTFLMDKESTNGIHPHYDFVNPKISKVHPNVVIGEGIFGLSFEEKERLNLSLKELDLIKPYYNTSDQIHRYYTEKNNKLWIIYTDSRFKNPTSMDLYPNLKEHLDKFKDIITSDNKPYGLHRARDEKFFKGEKIIVQRKCSNRPIFSYADFDSYISATFYIIQTQRFNLKYLTGILNSKVVEFWLRHKGKIQGNNFQIDKEPLLNIPIPLATEKQQNAMVAFVEKMLEAQQKLLLAQSPSDREFLKQQVEALDRKIDGLVYALYGLSEEEIAVVEEG